MATITNPWSTYLTYDGSIETVDGVDEHLEGMADAIRDRALNGGHIYASATSSAHDGVHCISTDNYVSGEWSVYDSNNLSTANKVLTLTSTAVTLAQDTTASENLTVAGDLSVTGQAKTPTKIDVFIEAPDTGEDITIGFFDNALTISEVYVVLTGTTPSIDFNIAHGTDRSLAGSDLWTSDQTADNTTTGDNVAGDFDAFADATVVANSWVWLETSGTPSGTIDSMHVTIFYKED